jgi:hypothetical protein
MIFSIRYCSLFLLYFFVLFVRFRDVIYIENTSASSDEEELLLLCALTESQLKRKRIIYY